MPHADSRLPSESPAPPKTARRVFFTLVRLGIGVGILVYLSKSGIVDLRALSRLITAWPVSVAAVSLLFVDITLMSLRLSWLLRQAGFHLPVGSSLRLTLVSFFFATFLPGAAGGDLAKLFYAAKENSGRRTEIATIVLFDRAIGLFSLLILPLLFAPMFPGLLRSVPMLRVLLLTVALISFALLASLLFCMFFAPATNRWVQRALEFMPLGGHAGRVLEAVRGYRRSPGTLIAALGASLVANLTVVAVTALAVFALSPADLAAKMCLVIPIGHIVNSLPLTPGGLGVGETAFNALFHITGLRGGAEALLCWRVWTALVGIFGLFVYLRGSPLSGPRFYRDDPSPVVISRA